MPAMKSRYFRLAGPQCFFGLLAFGDVANDSLKFGGSRSILRQAPHGVLLPQDRTARRCYNAKIKTHDRIIRPQSGKVVQQHFAIFVRQRLKKVGANQFVRRFVEVTSIGSVCERQFSIFMKPADHVCLIFNHGTKTFFTFGNLMLSPATLGSCR